MTNRDAVAVVLRLVGLYWMVSGAIDLIDYLGLLLTPTTSDLAWTRNPVFVSSSIVAALIYPLAGSILLSKATSLAGRWSSKPDEPAPAIIGLSNGSALLGIYFFLVGLHYLVQPAQSWIAARQIDNRSMVTLGEAAVYMLGGGLLLLRPKWLIDMGPPPAPASH